MASRLLTVYYDTGCNLCSRLVRFVIKRDGKGLISFKPLTEAMPSGVGILPDSIVVKQNDNWYFKSEAIFKIIAAFEGVWKVLLIFQWIPAPLRDWVYDYMARNRYRWFGSSGTTCAINSQS